jgi:DNA-directed RNA polymerase specialized sigma subunit
MERGVRSTTHLTKQKTNKENKSINEILAAVNDVFSDDVILAYKAALFVCHRHSGRKLKEIGAHFNVSESAVSQVSRRFGAVVAEDRRLLKRIDKLTRGLGLSNV